MRRFEDYDDKVKKTAEGLVEDYRLDLIEEITDRGAVELQEFFNGIVHDHVDTEFIQVDLHDCVDIIVNGHNVETDSGLWEGEEPEEALETKAFYTYRQDLLEETIVEAKQDLQDHVLDDLEYDLEELEDNLEELEDRLEELEVEDDGYDELEEELHDVEEQISKLQELIEAVRLTIES